MTLYYFPKYKTFWLPKRENFTVSNLIDNGVIKKVNSKDMILEIIRAKLNIGNESGMS